MARELPQYASQLSIGSMPKVEYSFGQAQATQAISKEMGAIAQDMDKKAQEIEELNATATVHTELNRMALESGANPDLLRSRIDKYEEGFLKNFNDSHMAAKWKAKYKILALPHIDRATEKYNQNLNNERKTSALKSVQTGIAGMREIIPGLSSNIPEHKKAAEDALASIFDDVTRTATMLDENGEYMFTPDQQLAMAGEAQKEFVISLPPEKRLEALSMGGGFDQAVGAVLRNEGGYSASDGNTGAPVNFGINQKSHPEVDVETLTKEEAAKIYKKDYWDAYKIGELRADQQAIVLDGVVNHWSGFKNRLVDAARQGASPSELLDMRRKEYERLAETGKYSGNVVKSWENRLDSFKHYSMGEHLNLLPGSVKERIKEDTIKAINEENKLMRDDPAKWGLSRGMDISQIVGMQPDPLTASVIPNEEAKAQVQKIKDFVSADQIFQLAGGLKSAYGPYATNAMRDLVRQNMPDEYQAALNLALQNSSGNGERVRLLFETAKLGGKGVDEAYKATTFGGIFSNMPGDPKRIDDALLDTDLAETLQAYDREGYSLDYKVKTFNTVSTLAKAYRIKNPSVSEDDAIDYAYRTISDNYKMAELNGVKYRVPTHSANGMPYDTDQIEQRLADHYEALEFATSADDERIAKNSGMNAKRHAIPILNKEEDGVRFLNPITRAVIMGKNGAPAELKFKDVINNQTPKESKKINMPSFDPADLGPE